MTENITIKKSTVWQILTGIFALLFVISLFTGGFGIRYSDGDGNSQPKANNPAPSGGSPSVDAKDVIDDDSVKWNKNAPVTIVEWSDFECPFCVRFYTQTFGKIEEEYINTGKVKFVYRDFPLSFHQNAQKAAESAECAGEQGKFWEMHNLLFEKGVSGGVGSFKQYAKEIGLDSGEFNDCLDSGKMASEVSKDFSDGQKAGIQGTPGFIINGQLVSGAQPFEAFKQIIDAELQK